MSDRIYVPIETFTTGDSRTLVKNVTRVREGHPLLDQYQHMFRLADCGEYEVEQATSEPGMKRGEKRSKAAV